MNSYKNSYNNTIPILCCHNSVLPLQYNYSQPKDYIKDIHYPSRIANL